MGFKIKNSLTGEFEKLPILTLKGEKGETGGVEEYNKVDYMGNKYETLKQANDANVEYAVKTAIGEFNYLDYDGQHITATDTIEGRSKSAILKGQTLVNLSGNDRFLSTGFSTYVDGVYKHLKDVNHYYDSLMIKDNTVSMFSPNKTYTFIIDSKVLLSEVDGYTNPPRQHSVIIQFEDDTYQTPMTPFQNVGERIEQKIKFTIENKPIKKVSIRTFTASLSKTGKFNGEVYKMVLVEGDYSNQDIPYFEGMQSVKMPVLKSTGKNLVDLSTSIYGEGINSVRTDFIKINPNKTFIASMNNRHGSTVYFYTQNKEEIFSKNGFTAISPSNAYYLKWVVSTQDKTADWNSFQIEEGSTATSYEPHKSNILTTPEDLELRGVGNIKDELNVATGELTQCVGEIVLNGDRDWKTISAWDSQNHLAFIYYLKGNVFKNISDVKCDKLSCQNWSDLNSKDIQGITLGKGTDDYIVLKINKSLVSDLASFKVWLQNNNITVQYTLETPVIKTVDLSDNHVYSYKDVTHYDCSSAEGSLVPTLSVKVPTDVQATIAQQRETIQTLNSENERLNQIQEALKASMLDSQVQLMSLSWNTDFEVFTLRESIAPKDFLLDSRTGSNIDKFSQAKFIIENDCPDLEKLNSQIEYYFSKDVFSQEQFEELTDLISIVKGGNGCEY